MFPGFKMNKKPNDSDIRSKTDINKLMMKMNHIFCQDFNRLLTKRNRQMKIGSPKRVKAMLIWNTLGNGRFGKTYIPFPTKNKSR